MPAARPLSRRSFLARAAAGGGAALLVSSVGSRLSAAPVAPEPAIPAELLFTSAKRLAKMIREKKVSSLEVVNAYFKRIDEVNPKLNAVVLLCRERALAEAKFADEALARGKNFGPLHGVPCTIKDSWETQGVVSTGGTLGRKDYLPARDATVVARVRAAGAIVMGKTNTPELTLSYQTSNLIYGKTFNPYKEGYQPGGSSGGAGAIVAAGGSPFDIGTDSGGSIRGPAHFNGITGIKPTAGRVPRTGHIVDYGGWWDSYQVAGPLARWVEDLEFILPIISGTDYIDAAIVPMHWADPSAVDATKLRVAYYIGNGSEKPPTPETIAAVQKVVGLFTAAGVKCIEDCPVDLMKECQQVRSAISAADDSGPVKRLLKKYGTAQASPNLAGARSRPEGIVPVAKYTELAEQMDANRAKFLQWFQAYDLIVAPAWPGPAEIWPQDLTPPATGSGGAGANRNINYLTPYNTIGWPGTVVRAGTSPDGLPIGVQLLAQPWREDVSLAAARFVEAGTGGYVRPPI